MKRTDIVELLVDRGEYLKDGVCKGMRGRITDMGIHADGTRLVYFVSKTSDGRFKEAGLNIPESELKVVDELTYLNGEKIILPFEEYARVMVTVEKDKYADEGVHKGEIGWICDPRRIENSRLVCFDFVQSSRYPIISVKERDMEVIVLAPEDTPDDDISIVAKSVDGKTVITKERKESRK